MKASRFTLSLLTAITLLLTTIPLRSQSIQYNISLGAGMPELLHAGVSFNAGRAIFGATVGTFPVSGESLFTAGANGGLHFAGRSKYTELPPWFALAGFNLVRDKTDYSESRYTYLSFRIGREMNFSPRTALSLDGGILFETGNKNRSTNPTTEWQPGESWFPALPSFSIKLIFRLPAKNTVSLTSGSD